MSSNKKSPKLWGTLITDGEWKGRYFSVSTTRIRAQNHAAEAERHVGTAEVVPLTHEPNRKRWVRRFAE